ncbi:MAG: hypothetical protein ABSD28_20505, partial [Tepidisphaeraceae bacterium]
AVELAVTVEGPVKYALAAAFFLIALCFVYRSFYGMRIRSHSQEATPPDSQDYSASDGRKGPNSASADAYSHAGRA